MKADDKEVMKAQEGYARTIAARYHELFPEAEGAIETIKEKIVEKIVEVIDPDIVAQNEALKITLAEMSVDLEKKENEFLAKIEASNAEVHKLQEKNALLEKQVVKLKAALDVMKNSL